MSKYTKWFIFIAIIATTILLIVGLANYIIDPLWCFQHTNRFNSMQDGFNERQQKTNLITFRQFDYDCLLLGSSRTTFIDQNDFKNMKVFNYSVNSMLPTEYGDYINYAKKKKGGDFNVVILGLDFFGTNENYNPAFEKSEFYINLSNQFLYRYKMLFSTDTLSYSYKSFQLSVGLSSKNSCYNRYNVKLMFPITEEKRQQTIKHDLITYRETIYSNYYYRNMKAILTNLKTSNPNSRFIVFTTPVSEPLFRLIIEMGLYQYYERWIKDCVEVFGSIYNFMYINTVTKDLNNYMDAHHFNPNIGALIAHKITGCQDKNTPSDFGVLVTKDNLADHLNNIK